MESYYRLHRKMIFSLFSHFSRPTRCRKLKWQDLWRDLDVNYDRRKMFIFMSSNLIYSRWEIRRQLPDPESPRQIWIKPGQRLIQVFHLIILSRNLRTSEDDFASNRPILKIWRTYWNNTAVGSAQED